MKWVTWRQYRWELIISAGIIVALAAVLVPRGLENPALFNLSLAHLNPNAPGFPALYRQMVQFYDGLRWVPFVISFPSLIIGVLLAIPIVVEFEQRTYRLAWTQSVTRGQWLAVKLGFALVAAVVFSGLLTILTSWFFYPKYELGEPFAVFYWTGTVPIAYTVFALSMTVALGTLSRRSAMTVLTAVVVFAALVLVIGFGLRPHYMTPVQQTYTESPPVPPAPGQKASPLPIPYNAWVLSEAQSETRGGGNGTLTAVVEYQPAERYWPFQGIESGIFLGMSGVAFGLTVWAVRTRFR